MKTNKKSTESKDNKAKKDVSAVAPVENVQLNNNDVLFNVDLSMLNEHDKVIIDNKNAFVIVANNIKTLHKSDAETESIRYIRLLKADTFREIQEQIFQRENKIILHEEELFLYLLEKDNLKISIPVREHKAKADTTNLIKELNEKIRLLSEQLANKQQ